MLIELAVTTETLTTLVGLEVITITVTDVVAIVITVALGVLMVSAPTGVGFLKITVCTLVEMIVKIVIPEPKLIDVMVLFLITPDPYPVSKLSLSVITGNEIAVMETVFSPLLALCGPKSNFTVVADVRFGKLYSPS